MLRKKGNRKEGKKEGTRFILVLYGWPDLGWRTWNVFSTAPVSVRTWAGTTCSHTWWCCFCFATLGFSPSCPPTPLPEAIWPCLRKWNETFWALLALPKIVLRGCKSIPSGSSWWAVYPNAVLCGTGLGVAHLAGMSRWRAATERCDLL